MGAAAFTGSLALTGSFTGSELGKPSLVPSLKALLSGASVSRSGTSGTESRSQVPPPSKEASGLTALYCPYIIGGPKAPLKEIIRRPRP